MCFPVLGFEGREKSLTMNNYFSYKNHDVDEPGFFIGMALPSGSQG